MANAQKLEELRKKSGKSKSYLAKKMNISRPTLYLLFEDPAKCTFGQVDFFCTEFGIKTVAEKNEIFLP